MTPLFRKLNLGTHATIYVIDAPASFEAELVKLRSCEVKTQLPNKADAPFAIAFVTRRAVLDKLGRLVGRRTTGDALIWIAYPKGSSTRYTCDFNRDTGWSALGAVGFEPVRQVAIDEDWSALRFRRVEFIKTMTRSRRKAISKAGRQRTARQTT